MENLVNFETYGKQMLVSEATFKEIENHMKGTDKFEMVKFDTFRIADKADYARASSLYDKYRLGEHVSYDFYTQYKKALQTSGLFIFISAFLGLAFLTSTGSILYFKQMSEAEQERPSFKTLRQLGMDVKMMMRGIARKQAIVFLLPLSVGLLHSFFAVRAASFMILSDITIPTILSMTAYTLIYFVFGFLTLGYYRNIVKRALL